MPAAAQNGAAEPGEDAAAEGPTTVSLVLQCTDRDGLLQDVAGLISENGLDPVLLGQGLAHLLHELRGERAERPDQQGGQRAPGRRRRPVVQFGVAPRVNARRVISINFLYWVQGGAAAAGQMLVAAVRLVAATRRSEDACLRPSSLRSRATTRGEARRTTGNNHDSARVSPGRPGARGAWLWCESCIGIKGYTVVVSRRHCRRSHHRPQRTRERCRRLVCGSISKILK